MERSIIRFGFAAANYHGQHPGKGFHAGSENLLRLGVAFLGPHHLLERLKRQLAVLQTVVSDVQRQKSSDLGNLLFGGFVNEPVRELIEGFEVREVGHCGILPEAIGWFEADPAPWRTYGALAGKKQRQCTTINNIEYGLSNCFSCCYMLWLVGLSRFSITASTANRGDAKSTITHLATTADARLFAEERQRAGSGEGLVRIAVGLRGIGGSARRPIQAYLQTGLE